MEINLPMGKIQAARQPRKAANGATSLGSVDRNLAVGLALGRDAAARRRTG